MDDPSPQQLCMWETFLPLASHTQFVEAGAKEARIVSTANRFEEMRTAHAVLRTSSIGTGTVGLSKMSAPARTQHHWLSAKSHRDEMEWIEATLCANEKAHSDALDGALDAFTVGISSRHERLSLWSASARVAMLEGRKTFDRSAAEWIKLQPQLG